MGCIPSKRALRNKSLQENLNQKLEEMGCIPSKKAKSLRENFNRSFPHQIVGIVEKFLHVKISDQIVAVICNANNLTKEVLFFTGKDNEGNSLEEEEPKSHKPTKDESENHNFTENDLEEDKASGEYNYYEQDKASGEYNYEQDKTHKVMEGLEDGETWHDSYNNNVEIIDTHKVMEGLEDEETYHNSDNTNVEIIDIPKLMEGLEDGETWPDYYNTIDNVEIIDTHKLMEGLEDGETCHDSDENIGGIITIPCSPVLSKVGSFSEWLNSGEHLFGSSVVDSTSSFGSYGLEIQASGVCSHFPLSDFERKNWDYPLFDPKLLAFFEKDLKQLAQDEKCILTQIEMSTKIQSHT